MARRRRIKGALDNFLSSFSSRYSSFNGYWLFGFLVDVPERQIDLLDATASLDRLEERACTLATAKVQDQLAKHGVPLSVFSSLQLKIYRSLGARIGDAGSRRRSGFDVRITVEAVESSSGRLWNASCVLFVAPHSPWYESRSARV